MDLSGRACSAPASLAFSADAPAHSLSSRKSFMTTHESVLELIGNTPIVELQNLDTGPCRLFVKMESQNPGGSIKDRIGLSMIEEAEKSGRCLLYTSPRPRD